MADITEKPNIMKDQCEQHQVRMQNYTWFKKTSQWTPRASGVKAETES